MKFEPQNFELDKSYDTPFGNLIGIIKEDEAKIVSYDNSRDSNDIKRCIIAKTNIEVAQFYYYIEKRLFSENPDLVITTHQNKDNSWGFYIRNKTKNESWNDFNFNLIWIHFIGRSPKELVIEVPQKYVGYIINSIILTSPEYWLFPNDSKELNYLLIRNITKNNIEEIMNILLKIRF